jgi:hypothetical protein
MTAVDAQKRGQKLVGDGFAVAMAPNRGKGLFDSHDVA